MMISYNLNWHDHGSYTKITAPSLNINGMDKDESICIIVHKSLSEDFSTDVSESKRNIVNESLLQKNYANISEYTITELKDKEYKEPSVTKEVKRYSNIFECGGNLLDRLDVTYQRAFMATPQDKYYTRSLEDTDKYIEVADGNHVIAKQKYQVRIKMCDNNGKPFIATLNNILLAPDLCDRLFSIITLMNSGHTCRFHKRFCTLYFV